MPLSCSRFSWKTDLSWVVEGAIDFLVPNQLRRRVTATIKGSVYNIEGEVTWAEPVNKIKSTDHLKIDDSPGLQSCDLGFELEDHFAHLSHVFALVV